MRLPVPLVSLVLIAVALTATASPVRAADGDDADDAATAWEQVRTAKPFDVEVAVGAAFGIGGWEDRSFSSASSYREIDHSVLGGFAADVTVGWQLTPTVAPVLRLGFGGGAFEFDQPGFGPAGGFDGGSEPTKESRYGHFNAGFGARFTAPLLPRLRVHATVGVLLVVPFDEVFTFRDNVSSEQEWVVHHAPGPGAFLRVSGEYELSPVVSLQVQLHLDVGHTRWTRLERKAGVGNFAPTDADTFAGVVRYETGDFVDESPASNNFDIRRHVSADGGVNGIIGAWGVTIGVLFRFG